MQAIHLYATTAHATCAPHTLAVRNRDAGLDMSNKLDDALAVVLHAVQSSGNPKAMPALGALLAYMEELERAGAYRVYEDPADLLAHLDEVGGRR